ncbi:UNKNOWN [Stylonychia lemnae]|uniref:Uncharacterized protein n=1 Tax=Stylonychia lemnae TaxID=5949 RepID=A0A078AAL2_STYLE|nr:UNKNOWN [Stylonychia lemnae]|eukprot:CDW78627.1 UNKNOWN [Stylonychia lemnae]
MISKDSSPKKQKLFSDFELHEGWIETCRNEKRSLIRSIKNSIDYGFAKDKKRAQQILNIELDNQSDSENDHKQSELEKSNQNIYQSEKFKQKLPQNASAKKSEMSFFDQVMSMRSDHYLALEEKRMGFTKKRLFNKSDTRCLQSKINLKFPIKTMLKEKSKEKLQIKEGVIEEFEKKYSAMCNQQYQIKKNRDVSPSSPFDKDNIPPLQYLQMDYKIPNSPNKQKPQDIDISKVPLAGRLSELGEKILSLGSKKAQYLTTFQMGQGQPKQEELKIKTNNQVYGNPFNAQQEGKQKQEQQRLKFPKIGSFSQLKDSDELNKAYEKLFNGNLDASTLKQFMSSQIVSPVNRSRPLNEVKLSQIEEQSQISRFNDKLLNGLKEKREAKKLRRSLDRSSQKISLSQTQNQFIQQPQSTRHMNQSMFSGIKFNDKNDGANAGNGTGYNSQQNSAAKERGETELMKKMRLEGILKNIVKSKPSMGAKQEGMSYTNRLRSLVNE